MTLLAHKFAWHGGTLIVADRWFAGHGADQKTRSGGQVAVKRQPGTRQRDQTGTVPTQDGTAA